MEESKLQALHDSLSKLRGGQGLGVAAQYSWQKKKNKEGGPLSSATEHGLPSNALYANFVPEGALYDPTHKTQRTFGDGRHIKRNFSDNEDDINSDRQPAKKKAKKEKLSKEERKALKKKLAKEAKLKAKKEAKLEAKRVAKKQKGQDQPMEEQKSMEKNKNDKGATNSLKQKEKKKKDKKHSQQEKGEDSQEAPSNNRKRDDNEGKSSKKSKKKKKSKSE